VSTEADADLAPDFLVCPIDSKVLVDAVLLPCCDARFCDSCIRSSLLKKPRCVACGTAGMTPDLIAPDRERRRQVAAFMRGEKVVPPPSLVKATAMTTTTTTTSDDDNDSSCRANTTCC
jgi:hypothetical protein